jgi:uroporphyrinogen decarboxylase
MGMDIMTSREKMTAVLSGKLPDRVPFAPTIYVDQACLAYGRKFADALINPALGPECMLGAALRYEADTVRFLMGPDTSWYENTIVVEKGGKLLQCSRHSGKVEGHYDLKGGGKLIPIEKPAVVRTIADVRDIRVPDADEYLDRGCLKDVAKCVQAAHREGLFVVGMCSGQTINFMVEMIGNPNNALMLFYDDPQLALALINKAVAISIERGNAFIAVGVDCLYIGDSYASGSVISPSIYRRFCAPAYAEVAREFHKHGVFCYKHCCGNYDPLLEHLPFTGIDAMDGIDPTSGMSVARTKQAIGAQLTLMGGISCLTLLNGTRENVYEEAKQCVLDGRPGGRYVLGSACAVPPSTPPENIAAARAAAIDYGSYRPQP